MKIGTITKPNAKGQIVIPKKIRDKLGIDENVLLNIIEKDNGVYVHPVDEVTSKTELEMPYYKILEKTQGAWAGDNWPKTERRRRKIELAASRKRKKVW